MSQPNDGNTWEAPAVGELLEITELVDWDTDDPCIYVRSKFRSLDRQLYSNFMPIECFVTLEEARRLKIETRFYKDHYCCWTCKHFGTEECQNRRQALIVSVGPCSKILSDDGAGFLKCAGRRKRGCGVAKATCWEAAKKPRGPRPDLLQNNLIFPKAPAGAESK
jgi:hypothetical protein